MLARRPKMVPSELSPKLKVILLIAWILLWIPFFGFLWLTA